MKEAGTTGVVPLFLAPWGPGTQVSWGPHGDDAWASRQGQVGIHRAQFERFLVTGTPIQPDVVKDDRVSRFNRRMKLPNGRRVLVCIIVRPQTGGSPGAIEIVTLFVE